MSQKLEATLHVQKYVAAVFEQRLRQAGFSCLDDNMLCWYRLRNDEVLDTVIFCTKRQVIPVEINIYYEASPLFARPVNITDVYFPVNDLTRHDCAHRRQILEDQNINGANLCLFSPEIHVIAPGHGQRGMRMLTDVVLPYFDRIQTVFDCYAAHKANHLCTPSWCTEPPANRFFNMSMEFMDEALYVDDREVYPFFAACIRRKKKVISDKLFITPNSQEYLRAQQHAQWLEFAVADGGRETYLEIMIDRERKNRQYFKSIWQHKQ